MKPYLKYDAWVPLLGHPMFQVTEDTEEWQGPCPVCGGEDRFHVRRADDDPDKALWGCRRCPPGWENHRKIAEAAFEQAEIPLADDGEEANPVDPEDDFEDLPEVGDPDQWGEGPTVSKYLYRDAKGNRHSYVNRKNIEKDGKRKKKITTYRWNVEKGGWEPHAPPAPRPLYELPAVLASQGQIVVVEGEKCAVAAQRVFRKSTVTTWMGGTKAWTKTDWLPLAGRDVILLPDADDSGRKCMASIAMELAKGGGRVRIFDTTGLEDGSDIADWIRRQGKGVGQWVWDRLQDWEGPVVGHVFAERNWQALKMAFRALDVEVRYNERAVGLEHRRNGGAWSRWDELATQHLRAEIADKFSYQSKHRHTAEPLDYGRDRWRECRGAIAHEHRVDPFKEWLEGLPKWDGKKRLHNWINRVWHVKDTKPVLVEWVSRNLFVGAVRRTFEPGCKQDEIAVLIGPGGIGKSSAVRHILPPGDNRFFNDQLHFLADEKRKVESLQGAVVVEASEMAGVNKADQTVIKSFLSAQGDYIRLSYREDPDYFPRRCIIVGTGDHMEVLPNDENLRRFVPVQLSKPRKSLKAVLQYIDDNRDQLWAEAMHEYGQFLGQYEIDVLPLAVQAAQPEATEKHRRKDELIEDYVTALVPEEEGGRLSEMMASVGCEERHVRQFTRELRRHGWDSQNVRRDGKAGRRWFSPKGWTVTPRGSVDDFDDLDPLSSVI